MSITLPPIEDYIAKRNIVKEKLTGALFAGYDSIYCFDCAGMTLQGAIVAKPNGRVFQGFRGERVVKMNAAEIEEMKTEYVKYGLSATCECGKVSA